MDQRHDTPRADVPACIGIMLDGNRRWAKEQGLPVIEGYRRGFNNVEPVVLAARDLGIKHIVVYAFSTENWKRSPEDLSYFMTILETMMKKSLSGLFKEDAAVRFAGQRERFSEDIKNAMRQAEAESPADPRITLWICLSYGGKADIVQAVQRTLESGAPITEGSISNHLWTAKMPDPELIIRTGGEQRISNFLIWQGAYSELFFVKKYWPAFTASDLEIVLKEYALRERRMGK